MYANPFIYKGPLYPGTDDLIMIKRNALLAKAISGLEFGHWYSVCGGKKIGKTTFLLSLMDECNKKNLNYHFMLIKPEELQHFDHAELYRVLCQRMKELISDIESALPVNILASPDLEQLKEFMMAVSTRLDPKSKIIIILDSFETLPKTFAQETFRTLINLHQSQAVLRSLAKFQFIVSGTLNTIDLQIEHGHSLSEYTMRVSLEDFRCEDIEDMLNRASEHLNISGQPGFGRLLYETTSGTGYLVQKICYRILERAYLRKERPEFTIKNAEMAIENIIKEGESNVEIVITQIEKDGQLVESLVQTLRAGATSSTKFDPHLQALLGLGALSEHNGVYRVRNRIYETAFRDYFTSERLADLYFAQQKYQRARELVSEAVTQQADAKNALRALLGNINFIGDEIGQSDIVTRILEAFMNVMDSTKSCSLMMLDTESGALSILDAVGLNPEIIQSFKLQLGQGVSGWVAQVGRPRFIRDVTDEIECPDFVNRDMAVKLNFGAMACLPLKVSGSVIGVINLFLGRPREFSDSEMKVLETMAAYASLVLQNFQFHLDLERYNLHLSQVRAIVRDAGQHTELDPIFQKILMTAGNIVGTNKSYLVYREPVFGKWLFSFPENFQSIRANLPQVEKVEGIAGHALKTGRPYVIEDTNHDEHYFPIWEEVQWELAVPCIDDGEPQGCIVVASDKAPSFSPVQMQLIAILADAVAIAIRNKRLYGIAEKKTQQVISAHGIGEALSHENSLQEILSLIANECLSVVGHENKISFLWIQDRERGKLILKAVAGEAFGSKHIGKSLSLNQRSIIVWVAKNGLSRLAKDVTQDPEYLQAHPDIKSEIAVPLIFRDEIIGVIDLQSLKRNDFDEQDLENLTAVAYNAAVATKIGELCDVRLKELKTLYRIGTKISSSLNVKEVLRTICREGLEAIGTENRNISVMLLDSGNQMPSLKVTHGVNSNSDKSNAYSCWEQSREGWVVKNKTHFLSANVSSDPLYTPTSFSIKSALFVPILFDDRVTGIIIMESLLEDDFGEVELGLITGLANQAGVAIANARLSEELTKAQIGLSKALGAAAIDEAVAGLTHDIKNFSSLIAGETQWLEKCDRDDQLHFVDIKTAIKNINSYVKKIEDFTNDLKGRAYKLPPELSWSNLNETIEEALNLIVVKASRHAVEIQKDDRIFDVQLYADSKRLVRAFLNIMSNAIDAMPNGGNLKITAENDGGYLRIEFSDTGMGIPEEDLHKVLDPFFTTKNQGYGLGLTITKRIVETDHRGKLILQSKQGQGTTVAVWLPLNLYSHPQNNNGSLNNSSNSKFRSINKAKIQTGNILVVNDDTIILNKITQLLGSEGHGVTGTESGKKAVQLCKRQKFDAIVLDYHLKKDHSATRTAIDFVPELKKNAPTTPIILTSATMDYLGAPAMYCDFFLEINHSFWNNILDLVKKCLIGEPKLSAESMTQI